MVIAAASRCRMKVAAVDTKAEIRAVSEMAFMTPQKRAESLRESDPYAYRLGLRATALGIPGN